MSLDKINVMYDYDVRTAVGLNYQVLGIQKMGWKSSSYTQPFTSTLSKMGMKIDLEYDAKC